MVSAWSRIIKVSYKRRMKRCAAVLLFAAIFLLALPATAQITLDPIIDVEPVAPREDFTDTPDPGPDPGPLQPTESMDDVNPGWNEPSPDPNPIEDNPPADINNEPSGTTGTGGGTTGTGGSTTVTGGSTAGTGDSTNGTMSQPEDQDSQQAPANDTGSYSGSSSNGYNEDLLIAVESLQSIYLTAEADVKEIAPAMTELLSTSVETSAETSIETSMESPDMESAVVDNANPIKSILPWLYLGGGLFMTAALFVGVFMFRRSRL